MYKPPARRPATELDRLQVGKVSDSKDGIAVACRGTRLARAVYRPGAEAVTALLVTAGYEAQTARDGTIALLSVAACVSDIAILDINMQGMDGYGLARRLRQDAHACQTIIVAFTSLDESATRPNGVASGFDAFCRKGEAVEPLLRLLEALPP